MFKLSLRAIAVIGAIAATSADPAIADGRVALVVGNNAYQSLSTLANPGTDAGRLGKLLADKASARRAAIASPSPSSRLDFVSQTRWPTRAHHRKSSAFLLNCTVLSSSKNVLFDL